MDESESKNEKPKEERRFDPELIEKGLRCDLDQYEFLKECSKNGEKGIKEWNEWREINKDDIFLEGADLEAGQLNNVNLNKAYMKGAYLGDAQLQEANLMGVNLSQAKCHRANLKGTWLAYANLGSTNLDNANLENAFLRNACLKNASLIKAHLDGAKLIEANLEGANLYRAVLQNAELNKADLRKTKIKASNLKNTNICWAHLECANFEMARVDGDTLIWDCYIDRETYFHGVPLSNARVDAKTKQLLEYNIRRMNWEEWYKEHSRLKWLVKPFWWMSDYGLRSWRIIGWFLMLSLFFAAIYSNIACWYPQGIVKNLTVEPHLPFWHYFVLLVLRPIYFSVVTMTTLGFGDMYANALSIWGHLLLTIQVILGYVLLGVLVTRFAVLFTAGGPAGKFADEKGEKDETE